MHSNPAEIGERIKAARKAAHLSQTELAQRLDKTMRTVQKYESGEIEPSIAMINAIAKILNISPADLIGYQKPEIQLDSLSDVIAVLYQLNKKTGIRFEIDVQRPPRSEEWSCSLKFKGNDRSAEMNDSLCLILEEFRNEREKLETYWTDQESFDRWIEKELAYYADAKLQDREVEVLSDLERIQRRNELDRQMMEKMKKAAEENGDQIEGPSAEYPETPCCKGFRTPDRTPHSLLRLTWRWWETSPLTSVHRPPGRWLWMP